jgi:hypothetical protein
MHRPEPGLPRRHDEHLTLPTWRVKQLQAVEHAALDLLEATTTSDDPVVLAERWETLREALRRDD